jgi:N-acetylglucosamine-6-phosphate deacetylase
MLLQHATVFTGDTLLPNTSVRLDNQFVIDIGSNLTPAPGEPTFDLSGQYLAPGLVDLQVYGGSWQFLNETPTPETVRHIYETHRQNGTTSVVPTLYSTSHAVNLRGIDAVRTVQAEQPMGVLGLHIEGPYINPVRRGAHSPLAVRPPAEAELTELFARGHDMIRLLTIAPEVFRPDQFQVLTRLLDQQPANRRTRLSLGHSDATYAQAMTAFDNGISLATHLYNAMRPFESREPGVVGAIFDHATVRASLIADGFHSAPAAMRLAHRQLHRPGVSERLFLISDASFAHPPRPDFALGDFIIRYEDGRYLNQENKLAGSSITLLEAVRVCVQQAGLPLADALRMASTLPAEIVGYGDRLGRIAPGYVANLVAFDHNFSVGAVWTDGQLLEIDNRG